MASNTTESLSRLQAEFQKLPGIGPRSAERIAFHLLKVSAEEALALSTAIRDVKMNVRPCSVCYNLTEADPCAICTDANRDRGQVIVVEQPKDVVALESTGIVRGVYHVLMGHLAPLDGIEPGDLTIDALVQRVRTGGVAEVILATNPTMEGDGTAMYIRSLLAECGVKVSRLARGLPTGAQMEYATKAMLADAIEERKPL
ncbi:MAG: recombination protein RecR [Phycisphaerae bacterium]|nr:recombination protein RecR [Phycisphaerae bacterium]